MSHEYSEAASGIFCCKHCGSGRSYVDTKCPPIDPHSPINIQKQQAALLPKMNMCHFCEYATEANKERCPTHFPQVITECQT